MSLLTGPHTPVAVGAHAGLKTLPPGRPWWQLLLSGTAAAAGIAAINSIGNLGGYFGPQVFGLLRDWSGADEIGLIFLAVCAVIGIVIVLVLGHNPALERVPE